MPTLAELQTMRAALVAARANGLRRVRDSSGEEVEYASDAAMAAKLRWLDSEIAKLTGATRSRFIPMSYSKGLD